MVYFFEVKYCDFLVNGIEMLLWCYLLGLICFVDLEKGVVICLYSDLDVLVFCILYVFFSGNGFFDELVFGFLLCCVCG